MNEEQLKNRLLDFVERGELSHAYILEYTDSEALKLFAFKLAEKITSYKEDIHTISSEGSSVKDKAVEGLLSRLRFKPLAGDRNIAIIEDADTMTVRAQNRLLKTLEEPPGMALILLLSNNAENLLPTIRSRCVRFRLRNNCGPRDGGNEKAENYADTIGKAILYGKPYYTMMPILKEVSEKKDFAHLFLDDLEKWFRDTLMRDLNIPPLWYTSVTQHAESKLTMEKASKFITLIEEARKDLNRHVNTGYVMKNLIFKMI